MTVVCLLHPGTMGASIGGALVGAGHEVRWVAAGRSNATGRRAHDAGLLEFPDLPTALSGADVVVSVCPPDAAVDVAGAVVGSGFGGLYLDANATAPATVRDIAGVLGPRVDTVDGGIVGPPVRAAGTTRLFVSGERSPDLLALFAGTPLETVVVPGPVGKASATKVAFASWTKGSNALLLAVAAYAEAEGVTGPLRAEWERRRFGLDERLAHVADASVPKAWRFSGELADAGRAFDAVDLPAGFGEAAAEIYARLASLRDERGVSVEQSLGLLAPGSRPTGNWDPLPVPPVRRVSRALTRVRRGLFRRLRRR